MKKRKKSITELARELRKNQTENEQILWEHLRKRRLQGYRFIRQKPFTYRQEKSRKCFFIADFYCPEKKFVIELDGKIHEYQQDYDYQRDLILEEMSLKTLRIRNEELDNIEQVKQKILEYLE